jgi:bacterioferritin
VLRYKRHYYMADGVHADPVKAEFLEHANEEQAHADRLSERIRQEEEHADDLADLLKSFDGEKARR